MLASKTIMTYSKNTVTSSNLKTSNLKVSEFEVRKFSFMAIVIQTVAIYVEPTQIFDILWASNLLTLKSESMMDSC